MAQEMRSLGINWNLAPVADVNTLPYNQVDGARSFGDDPEKVAVFVRSAVQGQRAGGVASAVKHFPGLGSSKANSDFGIARSAQTAAQFRNRDFPAFSAAIDSGVEAVLTAHLVAPKLVGSDRPTSLSRKVVTRILRQELGFRGAVITDSLQAAALSAIPQRRVVVDAFVAGNDMLLMPVNLPAAIKAMRVAVRDGTVTRERLDRSVRRILQMKMNAGMLDPPWRGTLPDVAATVGAADHLAEMDRIALDSVTLIAPDGAVAPLSGTTGRILVAGTGSTAVPAMTAALSARGLQTTEHGDRVRSGRERHHRCRLCSPTNVRGGPADVQRVRRRRSAAADPSLDRDRRPRDRGPGERPLRRRMGRRGGSGGYDLRIRADEPRCRRGSLDGWTNPRCASGRGSRRGIPTPCHALPPRVGTHLGGLATVFHVVVVEWPTRSALGMVR